ncbi:MAG: hypothetical protein ABEJ89_10220 [Haloarculaceae archaeon]
MSGQSDGDLDEVFGAVADGTRLDILRALWEQRQGQERRDQEPVAFSTLREAVGVRDSGRFNYHLDKLRPHFVRKTGDGYALTYAGSRVVGAAVSGVYTDTDAELEPIRLEECYEDDCAGTIRARYESGTMHIECDTCDVRTVISAPPILVGAHDPAADPSVLGRFALTVIQKTIRGFCHVCNGPVRTSLAPEDPGGLDGDVVVAHECLECGSTSYTSAVTTVLDHPATVAVLHEAGIDYREGLFWQDRDAYAWEERVVATDPAEVEVTLTVGEETLTFRLDEDLEVFEYGRD